ncbi:MAG: peptidylprolyl isomerase [Paracoccaceae bacterium]
MFKHTTFAAVLALFAAGPALAESHAAAPTEAPMEKAETATMMDASSVVATVNGVEITLGAAIIARQALPQQYQQVPDDVLLPGVIDQLIDQELLGQAAGEMNLATRLYIENQTRAAKAGEMVNDILQGDVSDAAIQAAYDAKFAEFEGSREFSAAHILVETEEEAKALNVALDGGADFAELAKEKSTGPSAPNGGDLGWFGEGMMVEPFEKALAELSAGDVSQPVQTQFGWHVIKLNETRLSEAPSLDDSRDELIDEIRQKMLQDKLEELRTSAKLDLVPVETIDSSLISNFSLVE